MTKRTRRGRRSGKAEQRRYINRLISQNASRDPRKAESINTLTTTQINEALHGEYSNILIHSHLQIERGLVLSDPRGEGLLQQHEEEEE